MTIVFALLAALSNAVNVTTQHIASTSGSPKLSGLRLIASLARNPLWLFGWVALAGSFLFQALALHDGALSVVQPLLVTELAFALILRRVWLRQTIVGETWIAAAITCGGLAVFLVMAEPRGGHPAATAQAWISAVVSCGVAAAALALAARWGSPGRRAALYASAAAVVWALEATFIKTTTDALSRYGFWGMFAHWPVYALALGGITGLLLEQAALHVGPLSISQPCLVIVDPLVSIALSVWLFGEHFTPNTLALAVGVLGFGAMGIGVVRLTRSAPATMEPRVAT